MLMRERVLVGVSIGRKSWFQASLFPLRDKWQRCRLLESVKRL